MRACVICKCTEDRACSGGCSWVEDTDTDLCSSCFDPKLTILPTRTCFDDVNENLTHYLQERDCPREYLTNGKLLICHGIISPHGRELVHAWLEANGTVVIDSGILQGQKITYHADLAEYYQVSKVIEVTKYTLMEAANEERRHKHYAPWVGKYRAMAGRD